MDPLADLNPEQREAVEATEGPVRVVAGPGTGKTRTLTHRYCHLVSTLGIAPRNLLSITFTNRAANEMKARVRAALGDLDLGYLCTFHAFGVQLLREDSHLLHYPKNFVVLDTEDQKQILLKVFDEMGLTLRDTTLRRTIDMLEIKKTFDKPSYLRYIHLMDNEELKAQFHKAADRNEQIFLRYLYEQKKCFGCDFPDLLLFPTYILETFPEAREKWQDRMQYVMVDEFQDVDPGQYKLVRLLAGKHGNLFIVGDPDQTIYSWRGADVKLFLNFNQEYPGTHTVALATNYRSTPEILAAANTLIDKNPTRYPNRLAAVRPSGPRPLFNHAKNEPDEAAWVCDRIEGLRAAGTSLNHIAILYRAHYLSRQLEERFIEKQVPYKIYSGVEFYGRQEIKDVVCYLRTVTAGDDLAFLRVVNLPPRRFGKKRLDALAAHAEARGLSLYNALKDARETPLLKGTAAADFIDAVERVREQRATMPLGDALQMLMDLSGYERFLRLRGDQERLDNVAELKRSLEAMAADPEATFEDFLARAALFTNLDHEPGRETVKLMTAHTAKGMEFPHVFVYGLSEGIFPGRRVQTPESMEEERRLAYVAMTRAMDTLHLSDSEGVATDGTFKYPSRFVFDAGRGNVDYVVEVEPPRAGRNATPSTGAVGAADAVPPAFGVGDRVVHPVLGPGTILGVKPEDGCYTIQFDKLATERSIRFGVPLDKAVP